jgi:Flp pilus assembly protein TadD
MVRLRIAHPAALASAPGAPTAAASALALVLVLVVSSCASVDATRAFHRGTAALDRGEPERAVVELERAAVLVPESSAVHNHLGIAYEAADRPVDARRAYERAVTLDCENDAAQRNLRALRTRASEPDS